MRARRPSEQTQAVLQALLEATNGWTHGYDLSKQTRIASGTLYPILVRLHDRGHLEARWTDTGDGRPTRHEYQLTASGSDFARHAVVHNRTILAVTRTPVTP